MSELKNIEYRDGRYYIKFPNDKVISLKLWDKLLKLIEEFKSEQEKEI